MSRQQMSEEQLQQILCQTNQVTKQWAAVCIVLNNRIQKVVHGWLLKLVRRWS